MKIMCNLKVQTKAALKGWSALTGDKTGSTPQSAGPKKVSTIFCWKLHSRFSKTLCPISFNVLGYRCQPVKPLPSSEKLQKRKQTESAG